MAGSAVMRPGPTAVEMSNMNPPPPPGASGLLSPAAAHNKSGGAPSSNLKAKVLNPGTRSTKRNRKKNKGGRQSLLQTRSDDFSSSADGTVHQPNDITVVHAEDTGGVGANAAPAFRTVRSGAGNNTGPEFCSNVVTTSKYTCLSFLPLFLFPRSARLRGHAGHVRGPAHMRIAHSTAQINKPMLNHLPVHTCLPAPPTRHARLPALLAQLPAGHLAAKLAAVAIEEEQGWKRKMAKRAGARWGR